MGKHNTVEQQALDTRMWYFLTGEKQCKTESFQSTERVFNI